MKIGLRHALMGLPKVYKEEANFRRHVVLFGILLLASIFLGISKIEWIIVLTLSSLVFVAEIFNSAIEKICDKITLEHDNDIGWIKDVSASGVLIVAFFSILVAALIFIPHIIELYINFGLQ